MLYWIRLIRQVKTVGSQFPERSSQKISKDHGIANFVFTKERALIIVRFLPLVIDHYLGNKSLPW